MMRGNKADATYLVNESRKALGLTNVTGGPGLHGTQMYPKGYGEAVAVLWESWHLDKQRCGLPELPEDDSSDEDRMPGEDRWPDCQLNAVRDLLKVPDDRFIV